MPRKLQCEMEDACNSAVTHIGEKGYIYCTEHAIERRTYAWERTRKMRPWEIKLLESGKPLTSYTPIPKKEAVRD
jgi:hypothetical protein